MPKLPDVIPQAVAGTKASVATSTAGSPPPVPEELRGRLEAIAASLKQSAPSIAAPALPPRVASVIIRSEDAEHGIRTNPDVLRVLARELLNAKSLDDVHASVGPVKKRLLSTNAYAAVNLSGEATSPSGDAINIVVGLQPRRKVGLTMGGMHSASGKIEAGTELSLVDTLGHAETLKLTVGTSAGSMSVTEIVQSVSATAEPMLHGGQPSTPSREALATTFAPSPSIKLQLSKPTLAGFPTPFSVQLRREKESHALTSGFTADLTELEAHVSDASGTHSLGYSLGLRATEPLANPADIFRAASSPQVVAQCGTSLKSAVTYAYVRNRSAPTDGNVPPSGYRTMFRAELAGLGGDVSFVKLGASHAQTWSAWRYAPDTGFALPPSASEVAKYLLLSSPPAPTATGEAGDASPQPPSPVPGAPSIGPAGTLLKAHPVAASLFPRLLGPARDAPPSAAEAPPQPQPQLQQQASGVNPTVAAARFLRLVNKGGPQQQLETLEPAGLQTSAPPAAAEALQPSQPQQQPSIPVPPPAYTWRHRVAGWLSPGVTLALDGGVSGMLPWAGDVGRPGGSRVIDRLFLHTKLRGFDAVGPRAAPVPGGTLAGDVLGGDVMAHASARLLLPPPLPSVRLANAGLRTQLWATAATLKPAGAVAQPQDVFAQPALAAGVGVVLPIAGPGLALEANYALVHRPSPGGTDLAAHFRMQLMFN